MLRLLLLLLLLANGLLLAWSQGWLDGILGRLPDGREPQRLERQVRPDGIRIVPPAPGSQGGGRDNAPARSAPRSGWQSPTGERGSRAAAVQGADQAAAQPAVQATALALQASAAGAPTSTSGQTDEPAAPVWAGWVWPACLQAGPFDAPQAARVEALLREAFPAASGVQWVVDRSGRDIAWRFRFDDAPVAVGAQLMSLEPQLFGQAFGLCGATQAGAAGSTAQPS